MQNSDVNNGKKTKAEEENIMVWLASDIRGDKIPCTHLETDTKITFLIGFLIQIKEISTLSQDLCKIWRFNQSLRL